MHACSWYWGSEALGCRTLHLQSQSSAGLRIQTYPRGPNLVTPGLGFTRIGEEERRDGEAIALHKTHIWHRLPQCPGYGHWASYCCVVLVFGSGLCFGSGFRNPASPGSGVGWVCLGARCGSTLPLPARVCGVWGWAWVSACSPPFLVGVCRRAWLCAHSTCTPPFPARM